MKYTGNYRLKKPEGTDAVNIEDFNENADKIDSELAKRVEKVAGKGLSTNDYSNVEKQKVADTAEGLGTHLADITNEEGRHGLRFWDEKAELNIDGEWTSTNIKVGFDITTWEGVQDIVRAGKAHEYFEVGDEIVSGYDDGEIIWQVIGIDADTPTNDNFTHSMTIQTKDCVHGIQFDAPEPSNPDSNRKSYGNNRYTHSAVKQWLNSEEVSFKWQSKHQYDATPTDSLDVYNNSGFLKRLDPELVSVIGSVTKKVAKNTITDGGGQEEFTDKIFLLSQKEVDLGDEGVNTGEFVYPFYQGKGNANRIKSLNGSTRGWWLRSPNVSNSNNVRYVYTSGLVYSSYPDATRGVSPACVII